MGDTLKVDLAGFFDDPDGDDLRYEAHISAAASAGVAVEGNGLTVTVVVPGEATVTAHIPGDSRPART